MGASSKQAYGADAEHEGSRSKAKLNSDGLAYSVRTLPRAPEWAMALAPEWATAPSSIVYTRVLIVGDIDSCDPRTLVF